MLAIGSARRARNISSSINIPVFIYILGILLSPFLLLKPVIADEKIRYGISHWPPYSMTEQSQISGINYDVGLEMEKRLGVEFDIRVCPFKRCLLELESGALDLFSGVAKNADREKYMAYSSPPYSAVSVVFYVRNGEADILKNYDDLYKLRVGYVAKSHYFDPFNKDETIPKVDVDKEQRLLPMLNSNRIDTYVGTDPNASYEVLTMGFKGKLEKAKYNPNVEVPLYFAMSRKSKHLAIIDRVGQVVQDMHDDGTMKRIHNKYQ
ncbi:substrate-binding periplasmic protein [Kiloniella majae]|uniref:substrate-binding periplasmic protein n=1 Tax=Kiloniella majae TaxID=1938558 RepID=UPI000A278BF3|nr:transporter substrate-binding domain-containing protein [Kiloniella majae]